MATQERRPSLPTGYRLLTGFARLPTDSGGSGDLEARGGGRRRKDNLISRGGSLRVRQVPIVLQEGGQEAQLTPAPLHLTTAPLHLGQATGGSRPQRYSLTGASKSSKVGFMVNYLDTSGLLNWLPFNH